jgi:ABC-2 type transport system permease protein
MSAGSLALLLLAYLLASMGFAGMGFFFAWGMRSTAGFHAIMMVFLMPLWMLSGALFPITQAPVWLKGLMLVNPVAHALVLMRGPFYHGPAALFADPQYQTALAVTLAWTSLCLLASMRKVARRDKGVAAA